MYQILALYCFLFCQGLDAHEQTRKKATRDKTLRCVPTIERNIITTGVYILVAHSIKMHQNPDKSLNSSFFSDFLVFERVPDHLSK